MGHVRIVLGVVVWVASGAAQDPRPVAQPQKAPVAEVVWRYAPTPSYFDEVALHDGALFALDRKGRVHAIDAATGEPRWLGKDPLVCDRVFGITTALHEGTAVVVVGTDKGMFAFRAKDGEKLWFTPIASGVAGPAVAKGLVVAGGADGRVYGFDLGTGEIRWQQDYLEDRPDDPPEFPGASARFEEPARPCAAATDGEMVALSIFDQCRTLAFDAATGKRLWSFRTGGWMYGKPSIGPLFVYVGSQDEHVYAIDKQIGRQQWKVATKARNEGMAAVQDRFVYCGSCDGKLHAVDVAVGRVAWTFPIERFEGRTTALYARPVVVGETVYLGAMEGTVYALDRANGKERWRLRPSPDSELTGDFVTDGERLFVLTQTDDGKGESSVLAIRLP
ncbi:MAG: PQQ-binding-like beta-propeller repeat protein [Planctomycetes bacterium]|nr:PQQ-binding-like beta-propeller repeat protein [Planctomycetota bacterium]